MGDESLNLPLKGIRVVELGLWIAGPAAGAILADWGAEVIKVEPPKGDPARHALATILGIKDFKSPAFIADNRGKKSLVLDLQDESELIKLFALLETADVFITNMRPGALERLTITPESLRERFPNLVIAQVTGYGSVGPEVDRPGYDSGAFWAYSGLAHQFSGETGYPPILPAAFGDHLTAVALASGISAALFSRERTGEGCIVETSLFKLGVYAATSDYAMQLQFDNPRPPQQRKHSESPLVNSYQTEDQKHLWLLCVEADRHWPKLVAALDRADLQNDERFLDTRSRHSNRQELIQELDSTFAQKSREQWAGILDQHDIWWAPVHSLQEVLDSEQAQRIGAFVDLNGDTDQPEYRSVSTPIDFNRSSTQAAGGCPELGADSETILAELDRKA